MEAKDKQIIWQQIHKQFPGMDAELDVDWDIVEVSFKAGIKEGWEQAEAHYQIDTG